MDSILWLTMRRMRTPLIILILVFSLSVFGLVLIPGRDEAGNAVQVGYLDAAYYVAILATTIGFGEYPYPFTGAQRLYAFLIILPNVVAWVYSIGTILRLILDPQFHAVLARSRFRRQVRDMPLPYFIVCGFGNTGSMIVRALLRRGYGAAVIEREPDRVHSMALSDDIAQVPALAGDVTSQHLLRLAGLGEDDRPNPQCRGVLALTNDDHANLTIAISTKLLRPEMKVLARSETPRVTANLESFATDHVIDPYAIFAERFLLALTSPIKYLVQDWLISVPGSALREPLRPPLGRWIVCGAGHFGSRIAQCFEQARLPYTLIDVFPERLRAGTSDVLGRGTEAHTLLQAAIGDAVGLVAGTGDDVDNLSIVMTARELNPQLFLVARQEQPQNNELFDASGAHLVARRSLIVARRVLFIVTTPLLQPLQQHLVTQDESFAHLMEARLRSVLQGRAPAIWTTELSGHFADGIRQAERQGARVRLEHITHSSRSAEVESLPCVCLVLERGASRIFMPRPAQELHEGDRLLFAGREGALRDITWTLSEPNVLLRIVTGQALPRGAVSRYFARKWGGRG